MDLCEPKASLVFIVNSRPVMAGITLSQITKQNKKYTVWEPNAGAPVNCPDTNIPVLS